MTKNSTFPEARIQHFEKLKQHEEQEKAKRDEVIKIGEEFNDQRHRIIETLSKFQDMWDGHIWSIKATTHGIGLTEDAKQSFKRPYRAGSTQHAHGKKEIERMTKAGVIKLSFAQKKCGTLRSCIEFQLLNAMTVRDSYPIPRMEECIDSLGTACVCYTLYCTSGYWKIEIHEKDRQKTGFVTHQGLFQFLRMPFGLHNALATFKRAI